MCSFTCHSFFNLCRQPINENIDLIPTHLQALLDVLEWFRGNDINIFVISMKHDLNETICDKNCVSESTLFLRMYNIFL